MVWPAVSYEEYSWSVPPGVQVSRAARRRHAGSYSAAVPPPIAHLDVAVRPGLIAEAEDAVAALARFDAEVRRDLAPFGGVLLRTESVASSKIERLTASARAIAESELGSTDRSNASLIVANVAAMQSAVEGGGRLDATAILATHRTLLETSDPNIAGRWREQQVWIGGHDVGPHDALFVPPHHTRVGEAINDFVEFAERVDLPTLVHVAISHAQFETIHPFSDGNGRTGRALVHAHLAAAGITRNLTVPISAGLLSDTAGYFAALDAYRTGQLEPIITKFVEASFRAVTLGRELHDELQAIRVDWDGSLNVRKGANAWRMLDVLVRRPVVDAALLADELGIRIENVYPSIEALESAGIVVESTNQKRNRQWRAPAILAALDDFAERSGRRG